MGQVFLAEDTALDRKVAVKFLPAPLEKDALARERFLREAKAAAALDHPYICKIFEIGDVEGRSFIAMEYVEGETLQRKLAPGPLPLTRVLELGAELAEAVDAAHKKQVVHRDIKAPNVIVTPDGHVKVLDFGLAKLLALEALSDSKIDTFSGRLTSRDSTPGTVIYMSPEQVRGEPIDARTDIFSLGVVLYEMATAKLPFQGATSGLIYDAILNLGPRAPSYHDPRIPPELDRIILKALEKDREHRYQSAKDLMVDLKRLKRETEAGSGRIEEKPGLPERKRLGVRLLTAAFIALLLAAGAFFWLHGRGSGATVEALAVLPFENTENDPEVEYLSDGIAESLINRLSSLPRLKVMARGIAFRYRERAHDPQAVGKALKVGAVLTGRLVQQGENLNVQAELVNVANGTQIWGEQYSRKLSDIVEVQNEIAQEIALALRPALTGDERERLAKPGTVDAEAYRAYWKGRFHWSRRTNEDFKIAIASFEEAIARDPSFALAQAGLGDSYLLLGAQFYGPDADYPPSVAMAKARTAAREALRLDPALAAAHVTLAYVQFLHDWDWQAAESGFLRAIELQPDYPVAHEWYAELLMVRGRHDEAISEARRSLDLEPTSPILSRELGYRLYQARRFDEAVTQFRETLELDPEFSLTRVMLTDALWDGGRRAEALAEAEHIDERRRTLYRHLARGETREALAWVESFPRREYSPSTLAGFYALAGASAKALDFLEQAFENRTPQLPLALGRPAFDAVRSEPRLVELRRSMGLEP
jgi:TolB-like protein/Tfp pilus assembly protein PilF